MCNRPITIKGDVLRLNICEYYSLEMADTIEKTSRGILNGCYTNSFKPSTSFQASVSSQPRTMRLWQARVTNVTRNYLYSQPEIGKT
jgi:hypothetical protein